MHQTVVDGFMQGDGCRHGQLHSRVNDKSAQRGGNVDAGYAKGCTAWAVLTTIAQQTTEYK